MEESQNISHTMHKLEITEPDQENEDQTIGNESVILTHEQIDQRLK